VSSSFHVKEAAVVFLSANTFCALDMTPPPTGEKNLHLEQSGYKERSQKHLWVWRARQLFFDLSMILHKAASPNPFFQPRDSSTMSVEVNFHWGFS
jgi:hypothetical protein